MRDQPGRRPTMNDVARDAGVSLKTVSRVVNHVSTVDGQLAQRVMTSVRRLGFRRNDLAASLRSGADSRTIALLTADLSNAFYAPVWSAVATAARRRGYHVFMASSEESPELERETLLDLCQRRVSGLLVVPTDSDHAYLRTEVDLGTPVVFVDRPGRGIEADCVLLDNQGGARCATESVLAAGHRRLGVLVDSLDIFTVRERLTGVGQALASVGLSLDDAQVTTGVHTPDQARAATAAMLTSTPAPTAIICGNNRSTIGAVAAVRSLGVDVAIAGFDDFETSDLLPVTVTIVACDPAELGTVAAECLFERIAGKAGPPEERLLPTSLVARGGHQGGTASGR